MNLSLDFRRALFGIGGGLFVFWLLQRTLLQKNDYGLSKDDDPIPQPDDEDIQKAIVAYQSAVKAGESKQALMDLNADLAKEFNVRVYRRKTDGKFVATDLAGKELEVV